MVAKSIGESIELNLEKVLNLMLNINTIVVLLYS